MKDEVTIGHLGLAPTHLAPVIEQHQLLLFVLQGESLAIDLNIVKEIVQFAGVTVVPMMPPSMRGVINLRGAVVPVLDLGMRFGHGPTPIEKRSSIMIVEVAEAGAMCEIGLLVDGVSSVMDVDRKSIEAPPEFGIAVPTDFVKGAVRVGEQFVLLLDTERTFDLVELVASLADTEQEEALLPA